MSREKDLQLALEMLTEGSSGGIAIAEGLESAATATRKENRSWTMGPGIQGLGIAEKITEGTQTKELALKVYVEKKRRRANSRASVKSPSP